MTQVQDPTEELYKQFHINANSINNVFQFYYNKIQELKVQNQMLTKKIDELERKLKEFVEPTQADPKIQAILKKK